MQHRCKIALVLFFFFSGVSVATAQTPGFYGAVWTYNPLDPMVQVVVTDVPADTYTLECNDGTSSPSTVTGAADTNQLNLYAYTTGAEPLQCNVYSTSVCGGTNCVQIPSPYWSDECSSMASSAVTIADLAAVCPTTITDVQIASDPRLPCASSACETSGGGGGGDGGGLSTKDSGNLTVETQAVGWLIGVVLFLCTLPIFGRTFRL